MGPQEVHNICRLCLCQDENSLRPLTRTLNTSLTLEDVGRFTGLKINAKECMLYAMCSGCAEKLKSCANFRQSCLNNDAQFHELLDMLIASAQSVPQSVTAEPTAANLASDPLDLHFDVNYQDDFGDDGNDAIVIDDDDDDDDDDGVNIKYQKTCNNETDNYSANYIDIGEYSSSDNEEQECHFQTPRAYNTTVKEIFQAYGRAPPASPSDVEEPQVFVINTKRTRESYAPQHLCSQCGKLVTNLPFHIQLHKKEKKHVCPHCPIAMTCKGNLVKHIHAVHLKLICKTCKLCGKGFTNNNSYVSHMLCQHGIGDQHQCAVCARLFNHRSSLVDHTRRTHSDVRSIVCGICGKTFKLKRALVIHMRVHSTDQPFQCSKCPKRFKSGYARKIHETTHSGIVFECGLCEKTYRYKSLLNMHIRKQHSKAMVENEEESEGPSMDYE